MLRIMAQIIRLLAFAIACLAVLTPAAVAEVDDPVQSGREALDQWADYPWYDDSADDVRPVTIGQDNEISGDGSSQKGGREAVERSDRTRSSLPESSFSLAGAEVIAWIVVGIAIVAIVGVLIYAILQSDGSTPRQSKSEVAPTVDLAALPIPIAAADSDLLAEARRWYNQGEYAKAMIYLYSHLLLRLDKGQLIRLSKGKTNRQYLREVGSRRTLAEYFESAMHAFESAFFGRRPLARDEFEATWSRVDDFHRLVEEAHG
jgi:hypothetical protein